MLIGLHQETVERIRGRPAWRKIARPCAGKQQGYQAADHRLLRQLGRRPRQSLREHVGALDVVAPQWIALKNIQGDISVTSDPQATALIASAAHPPAIMAVVHNAHEAAFDGAMADALILNPAAEQRLIGNLIDQANRHGYSGFIFDLENMSPKAIAAYPAFIARAKEALLLNWKSGHRAVRRRFRAVRQAAGRLRHPGADGLRRPLADRRSRSRCGTGMV